MATYKHNYEAFGLEVLQAPFMVDEMKRRADKGADAARAVAARHNKTGEFEGSIKSRAGIRPGAKPRAMGEVYSDDPNARAIEFGHSNRRGKDFIGPVTFVEGIHALTSALAVMGE